MKVFFSILLIATFACQPLVKFSLVTYYGLNLKTIIDNYCVNKNKPELRCNGKCYLSKKIKLSKENIDNKHKTLLNISKLFSPVFFEEKEYKISVNLFYCFTKRNFFCLKKKINQGYKTKLKIPPKLRVLPS